MQTSQPACGTDGCPSHIFVARQPIYDVNHKIWGYELFFRPSGEATSADIQDPESATASVIVDGFPLASAGVEPHHKLAINLTRSMVLRKIYAALPAERCVADLPGDMDDSAYLQACAALKDQGFLLATVVPAKTQLVKMADILRVDVSRFSEKQLINLANQLKKLSCQALAQKIETKETYDLLKKLGFHLFQGYLFNKPEILPGTSPNLTKIAKFRILTELADEDFNTEEVTRMISADVGLSYRLIRFINSPYFGLRNKISSISHAISLMGQLALRQWLMAVTLSNAVESDQGKEIYFLCIKRARFLEQLAEKSTKVKAKGDSLFLLGLFSKLDVLLCQDMRVLVRELNLDEQISRALCGEKTPYHDFLALTEGLEHAQWDSLTPTMKQLGLGVSDVAITNNMAILWATELLSATQEN